jgi:hypothetical protein
MKILPVSAAMLLLLACTRDESGSCASYLAAMDEREAFNIDLLVQSGYPNEAPIGAALSTRRMEVPCKPINDRPDMFPIAAGSTGQPWVLFVSGGELEVQGELLEGVSGDFVFYAPDGKAQRQHSEAVRLFGFEGFGVLRSATVTASGVTVCDQEFEIFEYADNGDVIGLLAQPRRSACGGQL